MRAFFDKKKQQYFVIIKKKRYYINLLDLPLIKKLKQPKEKKISKKLN